MTAIFMSRRRGISLNFHPIWRGFLSIAPVQKDRVVGGKRGRGGAAPRARHTANYGSHFARADYQKDSMREVGFLKGGLVACS